MLDCGRDEARDAGQATDAHATRATPVTSAQVWKAGPDGSVLGGGEVTATKMEEVADLVVRGEETLRLSG